MKKISLITLLFAMLLSACSLNISMNDVLRIVKGSGVIESETRPASDFTSIELRGSADVEVSFGDTESVVVEADDNILPLIETEVRGTTLVIGIKPNTNIVPSEAVLVTVTMKSLESVSLPGSGNITIAGLQASSADFDLFGSGNITADGSVDTLDISLNGSGNYYCDDLQAKTVSVNIAGSGNTEVYASEGLDARITGSGNIFYSGNPAKVDTNVSGSGNVSPAR